MVQIRNQMELKNELGILTNTLGAYGIQMVKVHNQHEAKTLEA